MEKQKEYNLESRLIDFAVNVIDMSESLPKTRAGNHIAGQLLRCGTSPAPNYGEAESAESRSDFIHKMKVCLKELRETKIWLIILLLSKLQKPEQQITSLLNENEQLILIFFSSVKTAQKRGIAH
jgi:four helix bundle protein